MNNLIVYSNQAASTLETVNVLNAMAGLSQHTQRAYTRWIRVYMADINQTVPSAFDIEALDINLVVRSLGVAFLKAWLGQLKAHGQGKPSLGQAKAAIVFIAHLVSDLGRADYSLPAGLKYVKLPRAESGRNAGTWLSLDEIRRMIDVCLQAEESPIAVRNAAILILLITCGLRRNELSSAVWGDLHMQGINQVLRVHGKGEKLRTVKLPVKVIEALDRWRAYHPDPSPEHNIFSRIWKGGRIDSEPLTDRGIWIVVNRAAKAANLPGISPHDLRRSFARGAYESGAPFELIRQTLGHSNISTTERYINASLELNNAATDIWAQALYGES